MNLTDTCIRRPVLAWVIMALVVLFGGVAWSRIGISQYPDVDYPVVSVNLTWEGAAPEIMETEVVDVVEESVIQVEGVIGIKSRSQRGSASITIDFDIGRDIDAAVQEVQTRVAQAQRRLPNDIDPPIVTKTNPEDQPIMWLGLSGAFPPQMLSDYARYRIKERLQAVPGVGEITLGSGTERNVRIWLQPTGLDRYGLTAVEVMAALKRQHLELPAGRLESGGREIPVRVLGEAANLDDLRALTVGGTPQAPVRLADVALIEDGFADITRMVRVNGQTAQGIGIRKLRGANSIAVGEGVTRAIEELRADLPEGMELGVNMDTTPFIRQSVDHLIHEIGFAILLTALVCWVFLRSISSTFNVLLAIPMSLLGTVAVSWWLGWTLNTFTLLGLGLAVGIVVDDAILVLENIVRRREHGEDSYTASSRGTLEIAFSALAATIAIIAIVIPVAFMGGIIGQYFLQFGVALSVAVALSYLEAVTLAPARCATLLRNYDPNAKSSWLGRTIDRGFTALERLYARLLAVVLRRPIVTVVAGIALLGIGVVLMQGLPREQVPPQDQGRFRIRLQAAVGTDLDTMSGYTRTMEERILAHPHVDRLFASIGGGGGGGASASNTTNMFVTLTAHGTRPTQQEVMADLRKKLSGVPGLRAILLDPSQEGFSASRGTPVEFQLRGEDWEQLATLADTFMDRLAASGTVKDLDLDYQLGIPELRIEPDRQACADLGVEVLDVAESISLLIGGQRVGKFTLGARRLDLRAQLVREARDDPADLMDLRVRARDGALVPLGQLVHSVERPALQAITRADRERAITVSANVAEGGSQGVALQAVQALQKEVPTGVRLKLTGQSASFGDSQLDLLFTMGLGVLVAYLILAAQFNSWLLPLTVLSILPLSLVGGLAALMITGKTLNLFSMIGLILLMGLAKKNSIVLVDFAARRQAEGVDATTAMRDAAPLRLRAILMTSCATIAGAVPLALGLGQGSEVRAPMALAIIGGMAVATTLSLLVVPAVYVVLDRFRKSFRSRSEVIQKSGSPGSGTPEVVQKSGSPEV